MIYDGLKHELNSNRQNPAVTASPQVSSQCFVNIAKALEAETLQGATAQRAVAAGKQLLQTAGIDPNQVLATLSPETQRTVAAYFV